MDNATKEERGATGCWRLVSSCPRSPERPTFLFMLILCHRKGGKALRHAKNNAAWIWPCILKWTTRYVKSNWVLAAGVWLSAEA